MEIQDKRIFLLGVVIFWDMKFIIAFICFETLDLIDLRFFLLFSSAISSPQFIQVKMIKIQKRFIAFYFSNFRLFWIDPEVVSRQLDLIRQLLYRISFRPIFPYLLTT